VLTAGNVITFYFHINSRSKANPKHRAVKQLVWIKVKKRLEMLR